MRNTYVSSEVHYYFSHTIDWLIFCAFVFGYFLDFYNTRYFHFGPSADLQVFGLGILVDNWTKYLLLMGYNFFNTLIIVYVGSSIWPWINSSIMNPDKKEIHIKKYNAWIFVVVTNLIYEITPLFSIGMSMTQIDFFICVGIASMIAVFITTTISIKSKIYVSENCESPKEPVDLAELV